MLAQGEASAFVFSLMECCQLSVSVCYVSVLRLRVYIYIHVCVCVCVCESVPAHSRPPHLS